MSDSYGHDFDDSVALRKTLHNDLNKPATSALRHAMTIGDPEVLKQIAEEAQTGDYQLA